VLTEDIRALGEFDAIGYFTVSEECATVFGTQRLDTDDDMDVAACE
jgi:hypothetical protein